jgi:hypothetical protein
MRHTSVYPFPAGGGGFEFHPSMTIWEGFLTHKRRPNPVRCSGNTLIKHGIRVGAYVVPGLAGEGADVKPPIGSVIKGNPFLNGKSRNTKFIADAHTIRGESDAHLVTAGIPKDYAIV